MKKLYLLSLSFVILSCTNVNSSSVELFTSGANISGVNGIHFGPDGYLYATSVIGSDISVVDTNNKRILKRLVLMKESLVLMILPSIKKENFTGPVF